MFSKRIIFFILILFSFNLISAYEFGYNYLDKPNLNISDIIINLTTNSSEFCNCWSTSEGIKCDVSDITYDEISGGDVEASGYTGYFAYIVGTVGGLDMNGNPWYLSDVDLELEHNLTIGGFILSHLLPSPTLGLDLGSGANRWRWLYVQNISAEEIETYNANILYNLNVGGLINGVNISNLGINYTNIAMTNQSMVNFQGGINATNATTSLINSPLTNLTLKITVAGEDSGNILILKEVDAGTYDISPGMTATNLGFTNPFGLLNLTGGAYVNKVSTAIGTASAPTHTFTDDLDTGMYSAEANNLDFATGGLKQIEILDLGAGANRLAIYKAVDGTYPPTFRTYKSRGTVASPTAITTNDLLGNYLMNGYDGSSYGVGWFNRALATQTWTTSAHGTQYELYTAKTGATATTLNMWIDGSGYIYFPEPYSHDISGKTTRDLYIASDGQIGYLSSSAVSKENIKPVQDTSWIYNLNVVDFNYKNSTANHTGMIAEEVNLINPKLVSYKIDYDLECENVIEYKEDNKTIDLNQTSCKKVNITNTNIPETVNYNNPELISSLINEVQNQKIVNDNQQTEINLLKAEICKLNPVSKLC